MKQTWTASETDKLLALHKDGFSLFEISERLNRSYNSTNVKLSRLKMEGAVNKRSQVPASTYPLWDKPLKTEGDAVILSDIEAPFQNGEFINRVLDLADAWNVRTLHLDGDLLHYDNLSAWGSSWVQDQAEMLDAFLEVLDTLSAKKKAEAVNLMEQKGLLNDGTLSSELKDARKVFRSFDSFDEIIVALGNHDDRYLRALDQALSPRELLHQIDRHADERWKIAPYYYSFIETEKGLFRATHPRGAGKNTAIDLAVQYHQHVIMGHSHRWSVNRDPSGDYWAIQTGHCVDEKRLAYVQQRDAKRDAHVLGATIIRGGYPFVLSPESPWDLLRRM